MGADMAGRSMQKTKASATSHEYRLMLFLHFDLALPKQDRVLEEKADAAHAARE